MVKGKIQCADTQEEAVSKARLHQRSKGTSCAPEVWYE